MLDVLMVLLKLSVVIPTLDEEDCIGQVMDELSAALSGKVEFEIIVVDGMSKDRTREIAEAKGAVVIEEPRRGYGRA
ncbi:MAG TPA: glycosyltransferase, partial [Methanomassiliicoccaceae archaeon]|nr:glycosyltransferase [Methanomassiliicoccaceae archaeon]